MRTYKGKIITLANEQLKTGDIAPDFKLVNSSLEDVYLHDFKESYLIINVVPSLDTPVCDIQTKTINEEIIQNNKLNLRVITISNDLPFAQQRWCDHEEMEGIAVYSDYLYHDFGNKFGVLINEVKLLARSVFVLNSKREIIYDDYTNEISQHLDYDKLLKFIEKL